MSSVGAKRGPRIFALSPVWKAAVRAKRGRSFFDAQQLQGRGEIITLTEPDSRPFWRPADVYRTIIEVLQKYEYDPDLDYFVWPGGEVAIPFILGTVLQRMEIDRSKWLIYWRNPLPDGSLDPYNGRFEEYSLNFDDVPWPEDFLTDPNQLDLLPQKVEPVDEAAAS